jgi:hypothetical protein
MKLQRKLCNGSWVDEDRIDMFINMTLERESWFAPRKNRESMDRNQLLAYLAAGNTIRYDNDWYAEIRDAEAFAPKTPVSRPTVDCDCGHAVDAALVMHASLGTSCPDCYDRMSN